MINNIAQLKTALCSANLESAETPSVISDSLISAKMKSEVHIINNNSNPLKPLQESMLIIKLFIMHAYRKLLDLSKEIAMKNYGNNNIDIEKSKRSLKLKRKLRVAREG